MTNKNLPLYLVMMLSLSGCGDFDRMETKITGKGSEICQGGVTYLYFDSGVTVAYNPDGSVKTCPES